MKKVLVAAILGLAAVASVKAQGQIQLYNYSQPATKITYGTGSGGTIGTGLLNGTGATTWTVGYYYAAAGTTSASSVNTAMTGDNGNGLVPLLTLGSLTQGLTGSAYPGIFGTASASGTATLPFTGAATIVIVAYNGSTYAGSSIRGHSAAFQMNTTTIPATPLDVGTAMSTFSVSLIPEPSTFALAGLGLASLLIFRRRN